jgi:hypothetical protein
MRSFEYSIMFFDAMKPKCSAFSAQFSLYFCIFFPNSLLNFQSAPTLSELHSVFTVPNTQKNRDCVQFSQN